MRRGDINQNSFFLFLSNISVFNSECLRQSAYSDATVTIFFTGSLPALKGVVASWRGASHRHQDTLPFLQSKVKAIKLIKSWGILPRGRIGLVNNSR